jgi:multimeric flavodoxin WrbA
MKVVAFNGSPRRDGNTQMLIRHVLAAVAAEGIDTELVQVGGKSIHGCIACYKCFENKDRRCAVDNDIVNSCIEKMLAADGVILGSPTYFANMSTEIKALIDRAGLVAKANEEMFRRKVGAAVVAVRRAGSVHTFDGINHFFTISQMIIPGASYWNMGFGLEKGEVANDEEGLRTIETLGRNMAWLIKKLVG